MITFDEVSKVYPDGTVAVDKLTIAAPKGKITALVGPSGCGKTTSMRMINRLIDPSSGTIELDGVDTQTMDRVTLRRRIGYVIQNAGLFPHRTVVDNVAALPRLLGGGKKETRSAAMELLERVGLTEAADRRVGGYSGGMKRRLDLALALVHSPRILFLDEPTTGLDLQSRTALWEEVARLAHDEGMTVFLTTQYLEEADALADRVGIIDHGHIVAEGTPTQLKDEVGSPTVEVVPADVSDCAALESAVAGFGTTARGGRGAVTVQLPGGESQLAEIVRALDQASLKVASLQLHQPSLDDVFLAKTGRKLEGAGEEDDEQ